MIVIMVKTYVFKEIITNFFNHLSISCLRKIFIGSSAPIL